MIALSLLWVSCQGGDRVEAAPEVAACATVWFPDHDADGFGLHAGAVRACVRPDGYAQVNGDCDDTDPLSNPMGIEACGGGDEDCDGWTDDEDSPVEGEQIWYLDLDADGHGTPTLVWSACAVPADGSPLSDDCDDMDPSAFPSAEERCNERDDDCDGTFDEDAVDAQAWYADLDGDAYGGRATATYACGPPEGWIADGTDCDDSEADVNPSADETCTPGDEDCDGLQQDKDPDVTDPTAWYPDVDGDGYGPAHAVVYACEQAGYIAEEGDCDDVSRDSYPTAVDICDDGVDQDCDGVDLSCSLLGLWDLGAADTRVSAVQAGLGSAVAFVGDVDGDGVEDVALGSTRFTGPGAWSGAVVVLSGPVAAEIDADTEGFTWVGIAANDEAGMVAGVGDLDGDGLDDVLVGAPGVSPNQTGAAYLLSGALFVSPGVSTFADATATFPGLDEWDTLGDVVAASSDLDGDGRDDLLLGSPAGSVHAGALTLVPGATYTGSCATDDFLRLVGDPGAHLAGAVDAGDYDGDGLADVFVGAEADDATHRGAAYGLVSPVATDGVIGRLADLELQGEDALDEAGTAVSAGGDLDGDGYADLAVGAPLNTRGGYEAGTVYVVNGPVSGTIGLADSDAIIPGLAALDRAGSALDSGDVDGDGVADLLIGVPFDATAAYGAGGAWLVYGPISGAVALDEATMAHFVGLDGSGSALAIGGDVDGDGLRDLLIGADHALGVWLVLGEER